MDSTLPAEGFNDGAVAALVADEKGVRVGVGAGSGSGISEWSQGDCNVTKIIHVCQGDGY